jgi:protein SCO1/2
VLSAGCNTEKRWRLHEISGHLPDLRFSLKSDAERAVTERSCQGYLVLLFFGFTNCQSECPTTLFHLAKIVKGLGENANRTRILFISLDPSRDTPTIMQRYLRAFDAEHALGLTGNEDEIENLAKRYRIAYSQRIADTDDLVHSAVVYVFDRQGHARLLITPNDSIISAVEDLQHLLELSN